MAQSGSQSPFIDSAYGSSISIPAIHITNQDVHSINGTCTIKRKRSADSETDSSVEPESKRPKADDDDHNNQPEEEYEEYVPPEPLEDANFARECAKILEQRLKGVLPGRNRQTKLKVTFFTKFSESDEVTQEHIWNAYYYNHPEDIVDSPESHEFKITKENIEVGWGQEWADGQPLDGVFFNIQARQEELFGGWKWPAEASTDKGWETVIGPKDEMVELPADLPPGIK